MMRAPLFNDQLGKTIEKRSKLTDKLMNELKVLPLEQQYSILCSWIPIYTLEEMVKFVVR